MRVKTRLGSDEVLIATWESLMTYLCRAITPSSTEMSMDIISWPTIVLNLARCSKSSTQSSSRPRLSRAIRALWRFKRAKLFSTCACERHGPALSATAVFVPVSLASLASADQVWPTWSRLTACPSSHAISSTSNHSTRTRHRPSRTSSRAKKKTSSRQQTAQKTNRSCNVLRLPLQI